MVENAIFLQQQKSKSHRKYIFSPAKQIYNFIPQFINTNKTQEKKNHIPVKLREEGREGGRSVLGSRTIGFGVRRSRSRTMNLGSWLGTTNLCCDCDRDRHEGEVERRSLRVKLNGDVERRSRSWTALRSRFDLFLGAISLAGALLAGGVCSLPLSSSSISLSLSSLSLSLFSGKLYLKVK